MDTKKHYSLIVGHDFSLSNNTDSDAQSDYSPGIWAISSQKATLKFAREILAEGNEITVTDYDNPNYHSLANKFIKELGLNQPLFTEPIAPKSDIVTNGNPSNLNQLKKFLVVGKKIKSIVYDDIGNAIREHDTFVKKVQNDSIVVDKNGGNSWIDYGKAISWTFDNSGATQWHIKDDGVSKKTYRIEYLD